MRLDESKSNYKEVSVIQENTKKTEINNLNNYFEEEIIKGDLFSDSQGRSLPKIISTIQ